MENEALGGHAMDLGNWVETLLGSYLCKSENDVSVAVTDFQEQ
jgi:hypothetical protein